MAFVNEHKNIFRNGILLISTILGFFILYGVANVFQHAPLQAFIHHEQKIRIVVLCCVFIGLWVAFTNDILAVLSPLPLGKMKLSFNLTEWRVGGPYIPTYFGPPISKKARFFIAYPWCLIILIATIVNGLSE